MRKIYLFICLIALVSLFHGCISDSDNICLKVAYSPNAGTGGSSFLYSGNGLYTILTAEEASVVYPDYNLREWNTKRNGSGTSYLPGAKISVTEDLILYAQWAHAGILLYDVVYQGGADSGFFEDEGVVPGSIYTVKGDVEIGVSRPQFAFESWNTKLDGSGTTYMPGDTFIADGFVTLYARWKYIPELLFDVYYDAGLGEGSFLDFHVLPGSYVIKGVAETGITMEYFYIKSWNTQHDGSGVEYLPGAEITIDTNMILYAQWEFGPL